MILSILVLLLCTGIFIFFGYKNKFYWSVVLCMISIGLLLFAMIMYTVKLSNYNYTFILEYRLYILLFRLKVGMTGISRIYNTGIGVLEIAILIYMFYFHPVRNRYKILLILPVLFGIYVNDPSTSFAFYMKANLVGQWYGFLYMHLKHISVLFLAVYLLMPFWLGIRYYKETKVYLFKQETIVSLLAFFIIDIFVVAIFILGPFGKFWIMNIDMLKFPVGEVVYTDSIIVLPIVLFLLVIVSYLIYFYKPFSRIKILTKKEIADNQKELNKQIRMIFHTQKNMFFAIELFAKQSVEVLEENRQFVKENLEQILEITNSSIKTLSRALDTLRDVHVSNHMTNLEFCAEMALKRSNIDDNIEVRWQNKEPIYVCVDEIHMCEIFVNLFNNAVESFINLERKPILTIDLQKEERWAVIQITDNGCGIKKKHLKKIFQPLFSTKQNTINWGVGLEHVKKVLDAYGGNIHVKSRYGEYTEFQLILPISKEKEI